MLDISHSEVHIMREKILKIGLKTPEWFNTLKDIELATAFRTLKNNQVPKILLKVHEFAPEAVLIHIAEFKYTKRFYPIDYYNQNKFYAANHRFVKNAIFLAKLRSSWYSPCRYCHLFVTRYARYILDEQGYDEWTM